MINRVVNPIDELLCALIGIDANREPVALRWELDCLEPNRTKGAELRSELMRTTERLEGVQKHVMLQVSDAREAHKRADDQATKAVQRADKLAAELDALRAQFAATSAQSERAEREPVGAVSEAQFLRAERDALKEKLANTTGPLQAVSKQFDGLSRLIGQRY